MLSSGVLFLCLLAPQPDASGEPPFPGGPGPVATTSPARPPAPAALAARNETVPDPVPAPIDSGTAVAEMSVPVPPGDAFVSGARPDRTGKSASRELRRDVHRGGLCAERRPGDACAAHADAVRIACGACQEVREAGPLLPWWPGRGSSRSRPAARLPRDAAPGIGYPVRRYVVLTASAIPSVAASF